MTISSIEKGRKIEYYGKEKEEWDLDGDKIIGEYEINFISEKVLG